MRLRVLLARLINWMAEPICGACRQPVHRCVCPPWWREHY